MKKIVSIFLLFFIFGCAQSKNDSIDLIEEKLSNIIPIELNIESISDSQLPNFFEVKLSDGSFFYVQQDLSDFTENKMRDMLRRHWQIRPKELDSVHYSPSC